MNLGWDDVAVRRGCSRAFRRAGSEMLGVVYGVLFFSF